MDDDDGNDSPGGWCWVMMDWSGILWPDQELGQTGLDRIGRDAAELDVWIAGSGMFSCIPLQRNGRQVQGRRLPTGSDSPCVLRSAVYGLRSTYFLARNV